MLRLCNIHMRLRQIVYTYLEELKNTDRRQVTCLVHTHRIDQSGARLSSVLKSFPTHKLSITIFQENNIRCKTYTALLNRKR